MKATVIFDLEATCEDKTIKNKFDRETIEIGTVKIVNGKIIDEFQAFIQPIRNKKLTDFCIELTHITQEQVDSAPRFQEAIYNFCEWAGEDAEFLSWGIYDKKQLEKDSKCFGMEVNWISKHRNIKEEYQLVKGLSRAVSTVTAMEIEKLKFEGLHHRGIDDARNIAKIYLKVIDENKGL